MGRHTFGGSLPFGPDTEPLSDYACLKGISPRNDAGKKGYTERKHETQY
tara:strand:- start:883 stop:1029 length:147 start_codon:yes stop_codon:yes gene_type:complete